MNDARTPPRLQAQLQAQDLPPATARAQALPPLMQDAGVPFDVFIQALTDQLDKAQASMALKARVGRLPMTFAVKDVSLDLRAFVRMVDDDLYLRPAGPGDAEASTLKLAMTTITKTMIEENAVSFRAEDPRLSLREALGDRISEEDRRSLERIGVRSIHQLNDLRRAAGADVVARLARMPVNRLQQAMLAASVPRVTRIEATPDGADPPDPHLVEAGPGPARPAPERARGTRVHLDTPMLRQGRMPRVRAAGVPVAVVEATERGVVLQPLAHQLGSLAEIDFGEGEVATVRLCDGSVGHWHPAPPPERQFEEGAV